MARRPQRRPVLASPEPMRGVVRRAGPGGGAVGVSGRPNIPKEDWEAAVGPRIAERAEPVELDRGTLIVRAATSVWASELTLLSVAILERLRARGLDVSAMRCRVGTVEARAQPTARRPSRAVPAPLPLPRVLERALAEVDDAELRDAIGAAASANLAWQGYVTDAATPEGSRAARVPRSAGTETDRQGRTTGEARGAPPRRP